MDILNISSSGSISKKSKSKSKSSSLKEYDRKSVDISLSELDILANKNKMNSKKDKKSENSDFNVKESSATRSISYKTKSTTGATSSDYDTREDSLQREERYRKKVRSENKDNAIYQKKLNLLNRLENLYQKGFWKYYRRLTPENTLSEIQGEYDLKNKEANLKGSLERMRLIFFVIIYGLELTYGYLDKDIQGWAQSVHVNIENGDYDNDLMEVAEKWFGGESNWPVEYRLLFSITISGGMFIVSKKFFGSGLNNPQNTNVLGNIMNSFLNTNGNSLSDLVNKIVPENISTKIKEQQFYPQQQPPSSFPNQYYQDNSVDYQQPSKFNVNNLDFNEQEIENVLKKMAEKNQDFSEDFSLPATKSIPAKAPRKRAAAKKANK
jgi:hypothetical protein